MLSSGGLPKALKFQLPWGFMCPKLCWLLTLCWRSKEIVKPCLSLTFGSLEIWTRNWTLSSLNWTRTLWCQQEPSSESPTVCPMSCPSANGRESLLKLMTQLSGAQFICRTSGISLEPLSLPWSSEVSGLGLGARPDYPAVYTDYVVK